MSEAHEPIDANFTVIEDGRPAFPQHGWSSDSEVVKRMRERDGMSLRDYFAGQALSSVSIGVMCQSEGELVEESLAHAAYRIADAMVAEWSKQQ